VDELTGEERRHEQPASPTGSVTGSVDGPAGVTPGAAAAATPVGAPDGVRDATPHTTPHTMASPADSLAAPPSIERPAGEDAERFPFGRPGRPLRRNSPFYLGFVGGLGVLTAYIVAQAILQARQVIVLIVVSMFIAIGLNPLAERLVRTGMRRWSAVAIVALLVVVVFVGFIAAIAPPLAAQTADLLANLPENLMRLRQNPTIQRLDQQYDLIDRLSGWLSGANLATSVFGGVVGFGRLVLGSLFGALTVLILALYFLAALPRVKQHSYLLVPRSRRMRVQLLTDEIISRIGGYVAGALVIASLAGASSLVFLGIIGLEYALTLALVVAILDLIPMVGATLGAAIVSLVALIDSPAKALACVVFYVVYQQVENYLLYPRIMGRSVDVPPALTLVAALIGGALLGVVGALLAIPTAAACLLLFREVVVPRQQSN
jgi:predicted PurR-regulated permease PerM